MELALDCLSCLVRQTLDATRRATTDAAQQERVMRRSLRELSDVSLALPPPVLAGRIHRIVQAETGVDDPYLADKAWSNRLAREVLSRMEPGGESWSFEEACRLAIAGNVIDFGVRGHVTEAMVEEGLAKALSVPVDSRAIEELARLTETAESILFIADNAGEIVFDRLLVECLPLERTTVAVRGRPILNDATREDARFAGISDLVPVIDTGNAYPGAVAEGCSDTFRDAFRSADLIVAKGQGNYETLGDEPGRFAFLMRVKCDQIALDTGFPVGTHVVLLRTNDGTGTF